MTKDEFTKEGAEKTGLSQRQVERVLDWFGAALGTLTPGDDATYPAIGKFSAVDRPARQGRNPQTKEPIDIAGSRTLKYRPAKKLRDRLNMQPEAQRRRA